MDHLCIIVAMTIYPQLTTSKIPMFKEARRTCERLADKSISNDIDPLLVLSVAVEESRLKNVTSNKGAKGPLQVIPKYWCPKSVRNKPCDYELAGINALKYYLRKYGTEREAVTGYAGQGKRARRYAERVLQRYNSLLAILTAVDEEC